jgi:hypothetical protein
MGKPMTAEQISEAVEILRTQLIEHASELPSNAVQEVFGPDLGNAWLKVLLRRVEAVSDMIVLRVQVNRTLTPQQALDATGRQQYTSPNVVNAMPNADDDKVDVHFFKIDYAPQDHQLEREFEERGLRPADPFTLAQANANDPAFADVHNNATHWKAADGRWCCVRFANCPTGRIVHVVYTGNWWFAGWWFAGVRK